MVLPFPFESREARPLELPPRSNEAWSRRKGYRLVARSVVGPTTRCEHGLSVAGSSQCCRDQAIEPREAYAAS